MANLQSSCKGYTDRQRLGTDTWWWLWWLLWLLWFVVVCCGLLLLWCGPGADDMCLSI